ncbi:efflux RND transporter periplasmic adaptor subunit [bacterium]|nr:efflux RND transporter periplasmic adaptor subunit [candidate division CSSED10-310 bacterium]
MNRHKFKRSSMRNFFVVTLAVILLSGCSKDDGKVSALDNGSSRSMAVNVKVIELTTSTFRESLRLLGETQANIDLTYSSEVAGRLEFLSVDYGDTVKKGRLLARVDYEMLSAQAEQAQAAYDLTVKTHERIATLLKDELVTQQSMDEAKTNLVQAEAQLRQAETALRRSEIKSTIDGVVAQRYVEEGEYVMPGSPLVRVLDYSEIIVTAQVPENRVPEIRAGLEVSVWIDALKETYTGSVDVILPNADPESRTFSVRIRTPNASGKILVGMAATINIHVRNHDNVIVVPQDVVVEQSGTRFVFVVDSDNTARKIPVSLGPSEKQSVVITSGLTAGNRLIVDGQRDLVDGQPINIIP